MIVYPVLRLTLGNKRHTEQIDLNKVGKILIFRQDRIGDMIITTPIFAKIKKVNPFIHVSVLASPINAELAKADPNINHVIIAEKRVFRLIRQIFTLRRQKYDVLLNLIFNRTTTIGLLARFICPKGIKVSQGPEKYRFYFNHFLTLEHGRQHMSELYVKMVEQVFGIHFSDNEYLYHLNIPKENQAQVDEFLRQKSLSRWNKGQFEYNYVVFNISSVDEVRSLSSGQALKILSHLCIEKKIRTILISAPSGNEQKTELITKLRSDLCFSYPDIGSAPLLAVADLIDSAAFVITPDTSIVHFASAMQTPVIAIYTPLKFVAEWYPFQVKNIMVSADELMPVSGIPPERINKAVDQFIKIYFQRD
jgi:ADP-heptose:LPS heptosyltransferase